MLYNFIHSLDRNIQQRPSRLEDDLVGSLIFKHEAMFEPIAHGFHQRERQR